LTHDERTSSGQILPYLPPTGAFNAYLAIQEVHNVVTGLCRRSWLNGVKCPQYGIIRQLYDNETLPLSKLSKLIFRGTVI